MAMQNISNVAKEIVNASSIKDIPPELIYRIETIVTILKAAGIIFLAYIIYFIISSILAWKANRRIKEIHEKINKIEEKIGNIENKIKKK